MNTLILDKSDPDIASVIADWQDGQEYNLTITVKQTSSSDEKATFDVSSVQSNDAEEADEPATDESDSAAPDQADTGSRPPALKKIASGY